MITETRNNHTTCKKWYYHGSDLSIAKCASCQDNPSAPKYSIFVVIQQILFALRSKIASQDLSINNRFHMFERSQDTYAIAIVAFLF